MYVCIYVCMVTQIKNVAALSFWETALIVKPARSCSQSQRQEVDFGEGLVVVKWHTNDTPITTVNIFLFLSCNWSFNPLNAYIFVKIKETDDERTMTTRNRNKSDKTEMREKRDEGQLQRFYQNFTLYFLLPYDSNE
jgi:hypothetical protein